ncbi:hypothetical protein, partial [Herbaspirillum lusitanum]|uniref:hypothetical protein n=1 Tax=Herbaspirillum lusitanum TaxID=213312 RepID=UPI001EE64C28
RNYYLQLSCITMRPTQFTNLSVTSIRLVLPRQLLPPAARATNMTSEKSPTSFPGKSSFHEK